LCTAAQCSSEIPNCIRPVAVKTSQSLIDSERLIANAQAGIKRQARERDLANDKSAVIIRHSRPSLPAFAKFDSQPHNCRRLVSDSDQTRRSPLDDARHVGRSPSDKATVSLVHKNPVVPDQCAKGARRPRARHKRQRQRAFAGA
jgi:hypothetical protein